MLPASYPAPCHVSQHLALLRRIELSISAAVVAVASLLCNFLHVFLVKIAVVGIAIMVNEFGVNCHGI